MITTAASIVSPTACDAAAFIKPVIGFTPPSESSELLADVVAFLVVCFLVVSVLAVVCFVILLVEFGSPILLKWTLGDFRSVPEHFAETEYFSPSAPSFSTNTVIS